MREEHDEYQIRQGVHQHQQRQIARTLVQPAVEEGWHEHQNSSRPTSRQSVHQAEQYGSDGIGADALAQSCHEVGTEEPFLGDCRHQERGKREWH